MTSSYDAIVVGGGFYGCFVGLHYARALGRRTLLVEAGADLLERASFRNQARVHGGYHYPRSLLTAYRSRANFDRFVAEFDDCIGRHLTSYYAIGRLFSNVAAAQFELFCDRIGAPLDEAPPEIAKLFDPHHIEAVYRVRETVFDAARLRQRLGRELDASGIEIRLGTEASRVEVRSDGALEVSLRERGRESIASAERVFNCTYSRINRLLVASRLTPIPLKHELAELAVVEVPEELSGIGVTVMCGPFFSILPFPPLGLHTLSHVRYTPHCAWTDAAGAPCRDSHAMLDGLRKRTRFADMVKDAARYLPLVGKVRHVDSLWEVKTVLPQSEVDDSRPILFKEHAGAPGLVSVLGSKLDNVYDMVEFTSKNLAMEAR